MVKTIPFVKGWILDRLSGTNCLVLTAPEGHGKTILIQLVLKRLFERRELDDSTPMIDYFDLRMLWPQTDHPDLAKVVDRVSRHTGKCLIPPHDTSRVGDRLLRFERKSPNGFVAVFDNVDCALEGLSPRDQLLFVGQLMRVATIETHGDGPNNKVIVLLRDTFFNGFDGVWLTERYFHFRTQIRRLLPEIGVECLSLEHWKS